MEVEFTVGLQDPFSYNLIMFLIATAVMVVAAMLFSVFFWRYRLVKQRVSEGKRIVKPPKLVLPVIKHKYRRQLFRLQAALRAGQVETRVAYQELSRIIRGFAQETTGLDVQNATLSEIESYRIPALTTLVREYYGPEFSGAATGNAEAAYGRTAQVIEAWR